MTEDIYCHCGCGNLAPIANRNRFNRGQIKGQSLTFIHGHNARGENSIWWNGGRRKTGTGKYIYWQIKIDSHKRNPKNGYIREHILIAEKVLGRFLPEKAEIHHSNGNGLDNRKDNLVICENRSYHFLLHKRMRRYSNGGEKAVRRCSLYES